MWTNTACSFSNLPDLLAFSPDEPNRQYNSTIVERLLQSNYNYEPLEEFIDDDGVNILLSQRYSGFFCPPVSSVYTLSVLSDDPSRLYFQTSQSSEDLEQVCYATTYSRDRWDYQPNQSSEPLYLEENQCYYFEGVMCDYGGEWDFGVSAKLHDLDPPYLDAYSKELEVQRVRVQSEFKKEVHVSDDRWKLWV